MNNGILKKSLLVVAISSSFLPITSLAMMKKFSNNRLTSTAKNNPLKTVGLVSAIVGIGYYLGNYGLTMYRIKKTKQVLDLNNSLLNEDNDDKKNESDGTVERFIHAQDCYCTTEKMRKLTPIGRVCSSEQQPIFSYNGKILNNKKINVNLNNNTENENEIISEKEKSFIHIPTFKKNDDHNSYKYTFKIINSIDKEKRINFDNSIKEAKNSETLFRHLYNLWRYPCRDKAYPLYLRSLKILHNLHLKNERNKNNE